MAERQLERLENANRVFDSDSISDSSDEESKSSAGNSLNAS